MSLDITIDSEPPLNEEDVPTGEWLCPRCRALHDIKVMTTSQAKQKSSHISKQSSHNFLKQATIQDTNNLNVNNRSNSTHAKHSINSNVSTSTITTKMNYESISSRNTHQNASIDQNNADDLHKIRLFNELAARRNPFADLVRISLLLNPREFELPGDYIPDIQFPGTSKRPTSHHQHHLQTTTSTAASTASSSSTREARYTSYSVKRAQELDRNNLPLILRTCYVCRKGCRKAPLIHCDYCPLVYHADCIDPPLTILPNTRWMCPNHVEPIAEEKLLTSSSFCERVKLWNHFSKPIDHESIKISFLEKVHVNLEKPGNCPLDNEFTKLGCRVPKRVKREYNRYIREIEQYNGESESEEDESSRSKLLGGLSDPSTSTNSKHIQLLPSSAHLTHSDQDRHTSSPSSLEQRQKQQDKQQQEFESLLDIALKYMIESSKVLEASDKQKQLQRHLTASEEEHHRIQNGDSLI